MLQTLTFTKKENNYSLGVDLETKEEIIFTSPEFKAIGSFLLNLSGVEFDLDHKKGIIFTFPKTELEFNKVADNIYSLGKSLITKKDTWLYTKEEIDYIKALLEKGKVTDNLTIVIK